MWRYLTLSVVFLWSILPVSQAQNVTIVNHFNGDTTGRGVEGFRLSSSEEHRIVINYYEPAEKESLDRLSELVGASLNFYIDQSVDANNGKIELKKSKKSMLHDMNEIVNSAIKFYGFRQKEGFAGFSNEIEKKIAALEKLDFDNSSFASQITDASSKKRLQYYFIQKELNDLKLLANLEVGNYNNNNLLVFSGSEDAIVSQEVIDSLLQSLHYDPDQELKPNKINYSNGTLELLSMTDNSSLSGTVPNASTNDQVLEMLRANNNKLDAMQGQINDLRAEQQRQFLAQQEQTNKLMQGQIDELRSMVVDLVRVNNGGAMANTGPEIFMGSPNGNTVSNVPSLINVYFPKGSSILNAESKLALSEVVDILARNKSLNIIITGYADRSGDAVQNLRLSQERSKSVKQFFTASGLGQDRFITRYLGDSASGSESASDRKVQLEFVSR